VKLTEREESLLEELHEWSQSFFSYETKGWENLYDKWVEQAFSLLPESVQMQFFEKLDSSLFHLNSLLRGTKMQNDASARILDAAKAIDEQVQSFADIKKMPVGQLTFLAEQQASRHRIYSFIQGGMTGTGKAVFLMSDFLASIVINLRAVQLIAMSFGNNVQSPAALLETIKVLNVAMMPNRMKLFGWEDLMQDLQKEDTQFYFDGHDRITDQTWIDEPLKEVLKIALISSMSKLKTSNIPILSMSIGASLNYQSTRKITHFAIKFYQYKYLLEKSEGYK